MATGRVPNADRLGLENTGDRGATTAGSSSTSTSAPRSRGSGRWATSAATTSSSTSPTLEARTVAAQPAPPRRPGRQRPPVRAQRGVHLARRSPASGSPRRTPASRGSSTASSSTTTPTSPTAGPWRARPASTSSSSWPTRDGERLLGAHIIGPQASLLIQPLVQAMSLGNRSPEMARGQYWIHPAMAEVVENALLKMVTIIECPQASYSPNLLLKRESCPRPRDRSFGSQERGKVPLTKRSLVLPASPPSVKLARSWVSKILEEIGREDLVDAAQLGSPSWSPTR